MWDLVGAHAMRSCPHQAQKIDRARTLLRLAFLRHARWWDAPLGNFRATVDAELIPDVLLHAMTVLALTERRCLLMDELSTRSTESKVPAPRTFMIARSRSSHDAFLLLEIAVAGSA